MPDDPDSPFPELHALDEKRSLPTLADLLGPSEGLPAPSPAGPSRREQGPLDVPSIPTGSPGGPEPPSQGDSPAGDLPTADREETMRETLAALMEDDASQPRSADDAPSGAAPAEGESTGTPKELEPEPAGEDLQLAEAFAPIMEAGLARAFARTDTGLQAFLEPMLRATVRRAIAEQMEHSRQFRQIGAFDRLGLRLLALLSGRSYEDILFHRTHRYQVEEVYLLRRSARTLVSYASHDPARHVSVRRVQPTIKHLLANLPAGEALRGASFDLPERRTALVREGEFCLLVAVLRGRSNAMVRADLDYALRQVEDRFGTRLNEQSQAFLSVLQPLLEGCLLIQSPPPPL